MGLHGHVHGKVGLNMKEKDVNKRRKQRPSKILKKLGIVNVKTTFNNTIVNISDEKGNTLFWSSAGSCGFTGRKKRTPFAAQTAARKAGAEAVKKGFDHAQVIINGPGTGREATARVLNRCGLTIKRLKDATPFPQNGGR